MNTYIVLHLVMLMMSELLSTPQSGAAAPRSVAPGLSAQLEVFLSAPVGSGSNAVAAILQLEN